MWDSLISEQGLDYKLINHSTKQETKGNNSTSSQPLPAIRTSKKADSFPKRSFVNILLIILTSLQVVIIVRSQVYIHASLLRSFLNFYADSQVYPELFQGNAFYTNIQDLQELQDHINYIIKTINSSTIQTIVNMNFHKANVTLQVQYRPNVEGSKQQSTYPINPYKGIKQPFDSQSLDELQQFLLDTRYFQIVVDDLQIENDGLFEKYIHRVKYRYQNGNFIEVNYEFEISNALESSIRIQRPQANYLIFLRVFYLIVLCLAFISFYFNGSYIRKVLKEFYSSLEVHAHVPQKISKSTSSEYDFTKEEIKEIHNSIEINIQVRQITINNLKWLDYFQIIQFDILFSVVANAFQIIGNFYLLFGRQHEIIVGLGCLFAWMTIFRLLQEYQRLIMMYELIKMSILRVIQFMVSFLIIFMGYTFCGMCLFAKSIYFSSLSRAVTTLASMMAGDSISDITCRLAQKRSKLMVIIFIFSYIILFMHAIHNTLISILKEYFILKKIEILKQEKAIRGEQQYTYIQQLPNQKEEELNRMRLKISSKLQREIALKVKQQKFNRYNRNIRILLRMLQNSISREKWQSYDLDLHRHPAFEEIFKNRLEKMAQMLNKMGNQVQPAIKMKSFRQMSQ